jgi:tetratricopeptide (TPR) repeat protein
MGQARMRQGRPRDAVAAVEPALPLLSKAVDRDHEADARLLLGLALTLIGTPEAADAHLERALSLAQALGDARREAYALAGLGRAALARDEFGPAVEWLLDASTALHDGVSESDGAAIDRLLAEALVALEHPDAAQARVQMAAAAHRRLGDHANLSDDLRFLAALSMDQHDLAGARSFARQAAAAARDADDPEGEVDALVALAHAESLGGDWPAASKTLDAALELVNQEGEPFDQVRLLILAADVARRAGDAKRSDSLLEQARRLARTHNDPALRSRSIIDTRLGRPPDFTPAVPKPATSRAPR